VIRVHLPAHLRKQKGQRVLEVDLGPGSTLEDLLLYLADNTDKRFADLAARGTSGNAWINNVVLNDRRLELPRDLPLELSDGDRVYFIHPIAGG